MRLAVEGVAAVPVVDVEVDVVGVGLPVEDEAERGALLGGAARARQPLADLDGARRLDRGPGGGGQAQILAQDALDAAETPLRVALTGTDGERRERRARLTGLEEG